LLLVLPALEELVWILTANAKSEFEFLPLPAGETFEPITLAGSVISAGLFGAGASAELDG
jgi:hypothetical protein